MCWVTRAENSATLKLQRGEMNASERMSQRIARAPVSLFAAPCERAKLTHATVKAPKTGIRRGLRFQWRAPGAVADPRYGMKPATHRFSKSLCSPAA